MRFDRIGLDTRARPSLRLGDDKDSYFARTRIDAHAAHDLLK